MKKEKKKGFLSYFSAKGRASRGEFFVIGLIVFIVPILVFILPRMHLLNGGFDLMEFLITIGSSMLIGWILIIPLFWLTTVSYIRRLHDINKPGYIVFIMLFILFIPFLGQLAFLLFSFLLLVLPGTHHRNQYDIIYCPKCLTENKYGYTKCFSCKENLEEEENTTSVTNVVAVSINNIKKLDNLTPVVHNEVINISEILENLSEVALIKDTKEKYLKTFDLLSKVEDTPLDKSLRSEIEDRLKLIIDIDKLEDILKEEVDSYSKINLLYNDYLELSESFKNENEKLIKSLDLFFEEFNNLKTLDFTVNENNFAMNKYKYKTFIKNYDLIKEKISNNDNLINEYSTLDTIVLVKNIEKSLIDIIDSNNFKSLFNYLSFLENDLANKDLKLLIVKNFNLELEDINIDKINSFKNEISSTNNVNSKINEFIELKSVIESIDINKLKMSISNLESKKGKQSKLIYSIILIIILISIGLFFKTDIEKYFVKSNLVSKYTNVKVYFYKDSAQISELKYTNKEKEVYEKYFNNGLLEKKDVNNLNLNEKISENYFSDGSIRTRSILKDNIVILEETFFDNGNLKSKITNDGKNKIKNIFYKSGKLKQISRFLNNVLHGKQEEFHKREGQLKHVKLYKNGIIYGNEKEFFRNNQIKIIKPYSSCKGSKSKLHGIVKEYYSNGKLKLNKVYNCGNLKILKEYYENGQLKHKQDLSSYFEWDAIRYYKNGIIKSKRTQKYDRYLQRKVLLHKEYHKNKKIAYEAKCSRAFNRLITRDEYRMWHEDGTKKVLDRGFITGEIYVMSGGKCEYLIK